VSPSSIAWAVLEGALTSVADKECSVVGFLSVYIANCFLQMEMWQGVVHGN
jgi:hypothetical protein